MGRARTTNPATPDPYSPAPPFPRAPEPDRRLRLPVLASGPRAQRPRARHSSIGRWRAGVLILVHVLMIAHVLHWWFTGRSVGRFVLSDSMRTLELGEINPGFIFFVVALGVTAIFGRFICGWVCHMGAMQDLCAWLLRRVGIRPRLFRSRLLGFVPLGLAIYMFVWPAASREVARRIIEPAWPEMGASLNATPFPGWSTDLVTDSLWSGLPSWGVAIPFLLICGFATVYFLGARGLCRYGCPYGGLLLPAEQLAPARVVVDTPRCDQCGICTSVCTAGVRVHDEVRLHGAVTDRNCIRSFDCVAACPSRALRFRPAAPALLSRRSGNRPKTRYDLTLAEELACIAVFAGVFLTTRGLYEQIPLLLSATLGVIGAFLAWKLIRLFRDAHVRLAAFQLKLHGRLRPAGAAFAAGVAILAALLLHSAAVRIILVRADFHDDRVATPYEAAVAGRGASDGDLAEARKAARLYRLARPIREGGIALARTPSAEFRLAWMHVVAAERDRALDVLRSLEASGRAGAEAASERARLLLAWRRVEEARDVLERALLEHPRSASLRDMLASLLAGAGRIAEAETLYRDALAARPRDGDARAGFARLLLHTGRVDAAIGELARVSGDWPGKSGARRDLAVALFMAGRLDEAIAELADAARARPAQRAHLEALSAEMLRRAGR